MGFMFCDLHVSQNLPFAGGYKFDEFVFLVLEKAFSYNFFVKFHGKNNL